MKRIRSIAGLVLSLCAACAMHAQAPQGGRAAVAASQMPLALQNVGFEPELNAQMPLDLAFRDEAGKSVALYSSPLKIWRRGSEIPVLLHPIPTRCENDRLRNNTGATFSSWEEDVAKLCCLFLLNGNRISQQRFIARRSRPSGRNLSSN